MKKECVHTGRTVEEAIELGAQKLGYPREDVQFEILDLPRKGFLGLGSQPAKVMVFVYTDEPEPVPAPKAEPKREAPKQEKPAAPKAAPAPEAPKEEEPKVPKNFGNKPQVAADYLKSVMAQMGLTDADVAVKEKEDQAVLSLSGEGLGMIIGRRGETLDALQYLTCLVANREEGDYLRITIDSGNYREKREKTLENLARKLANTAVRTGRSSTLEPMNPYERRIIHSAVATVEGASSSSIGEEPNRRVVISSTNPAPRRPRGGAGRDNRGGNRSGGASRGGSRPEGGRRYDDRPRKPRAPREDKPSQEVASTRTAPKVEAAEQPLYGKIDL